MIANFLSGIFLIFILSCIVIGMPLTVVYSVYAKSNVYLNKNTKFRIKKYFNKEGNECYKVQWKRFYHWHSVWINDSWSNKVESIHSSESDAIDELNLIMIKIMNIIHEKNDVMYSNIISPKDIIYNEKN